MKKFRYILKTMRPKQWIKNFFVFPALLFSKSFTDPRAIGLSVLAFLLFSLGSGSVYIINDVIDRKKDILHPRKCKRPIASGKLKAGEALAAAAMILIGVVAAAAYVSIKFMGILVLYILITILYSLKLKSTPILDILAIAAGFVLRTLSGAVIIGVEASSWLLLCTSALCLFLAANKRKTELETMKEAAGEYKANLGVYTLPFLNQIITVCLTLCIVLYALYTYYTKVPYMMGTTAFVFYGLCRYQLLMAAGELGDNIEVTLLKDKPMVLNLVLWGLSCLAIIWKFY